MKWVKTKDGIPREGEEVLLNVNGVVHLAIFDKPGNSFKIHVGGTVPANSKCLWLRIEHKDIKP